MGLGAFESGGDGKGWSVKLGADFLRLSALS